MYHNTQFDFACIDTTPIAVIASVSREYGLDLMMMFKYSVNTQKFKVFLEELRRKYPFDDILLIMDQLTAHTCRASKERMEELGYRYSWSPIKSPQYNGGVEETFAMAKREIKRRRLNAIINNQQIDM